jgi:hypothetical protein
MKYEPNLVEKKGAKKLKMRMIDGDLTLSGPPLPGPLYS